MAFSSAQYILRPASYFFCKIIRMIGIISMTRIIRMTTIVLTNTPTITYQTKSKSIFQEVSSHRPFQSLKYQAVDREDYCEFTTSLVISYLYLYFF